MELLRIIAMVMVLVLHFNCAVKQIDYTTWKDITGMQIFHFSLESACIIAVNVFVIISGWYSIKFSLGRLLKFLFTVSWFAILGIIVSYILSGEVPRIGTMAKAIILMDGGWWFVRCYLVLFVFSPILNLYSQKASLVELRNTVLLFYVVQTFFGWFLGNDFNAGYSSISFIGLYLLGRYFYELDALQLLKANIAWMVFIASTLLNILYTISFYMGYNVSMSSPFDYTNPLVVISALSLVVAFSKLRIRSNIINWIAASSFAIYLFHMHGMFFDSYYLTHLRNIYNLHDGAMCFGLVICYLLGIAAIAILIDQPRKLFWNWLTKSVVNKEVSLQKD